ncbi:MAG: hypothetical protein KUG77_22175 [Nannocystaceae bacterium]|nr:hypothetical protein [Nannocystaceae bacterium]
MSSNPQSLEPGERHELLTALDRLEERLETAPAGLRAVGRAAEVGALEASNLPPDAALLWEKYDGVELMSGEARVLPLADLAGATARAGEEGLLRPGDLVIGERGRLLYALPADPWAEGASVVSISEENERSPEASSVMRLLLGLLGEVSVLYDDHGEFHDALIDEWGDLEPATRRKLLRRRLDFDPIAPGPRLQLARLLLLSGEQRAAFKEVEKVLHYAPEFSAAHFVRGQALRGLGKLDQARRAFARAAEHAYDPVNAAEYEAWAARVALEAHASSGAEADAGHAAAHASGVQRRRPDYAQNQLLGARARLQQGDGDIAAELLALGLAVAPRNLELLQLRRELEEAEY